MRHLVLLLTVLFASGCSTVGDYLGGDDTADPPAALVDIETTLKVTRVWSNGAGNGAGDFGTSLTLAVDGENVYVADYEGRVTALALADGKRRWEVKTDLRLSGGPGVADGSVVVGSADAELLGLAADSGTELWRTRVSSEVLAPPQLAQGVAVIRTVDGRLAAHDTGSGQRLWLYDSSVPVLSLRGTSTPLISGDAVLSGFANGKLAALSLHEGRLLWESNVAVPRGRSELDRMVDIDGAPVISAATVYAASYQGRVAALSLRSGALLWSREMSSYSGLGVSGNRILAGDAESHIWALDGDNGAAYWRQENLHLRNVTAPVAVGDAVVVGDFEGYLHFMSIDDGRFVARYQISKSAIATSPVVIGERIYVLDVSGRVTALQIGKG